jgi:hypothetical protein
MVVQHEVCVKVQPLREHRDRAPLGLENRHPDAAEVFPVHVEG